MSYYVSVDARTFTLNETDTAASVLQNVALILSTAKGSAPLYREFGIDTSVVDRPAPVAKVLMLTAVREAIEQYEPRAEVLGVTFQQDKDDPGILIPTVEIDIK